jgi:hypothetical protein
VGRSLTLLAALAAASLFAGCGGASSAPGPVLEYDACQPLALVTDPSVTDIQAAGIAAGIALWNDRAGTRLTVAPADPGEAMPSVPLHFQAAAPPFHGLYDGGQIYINDDLTGVPQSVVIAHEVGHAFGLVHIAASERASLMNPGNMTIEPTASDIDTLSTRWGHCR